MYTDDDSKSKYPCRKRRQLPKLPFKETTSKATTTKFLSKIRKRKKIFNGQFNHCEAKISLDKIIKSINFQTNEFPGNHGLNTEFYKHFSNELAPVFLDVYDSW